MFDVQRKLDRIECKVTQYSDEGEEVRPIVEVTERLGLLLPRIIPFFQNPVNISGTNIEGYVQMFMAGVNDVYINSGHAI